MGLPGTTELLLLFGVLVLMFGAAKLPKLGGAIGEGIRNFKKGIRGSPDRAGHEEEAALPGHAKDQKPGSGGG